MRTKKATRTRKPVAARPTEEQPHAAAASEKPATETPAADTKPSSPREVIGMEMRMERLTHGKPAPCVETDLRSYIGFLERKYGLTIHAVDYQKRPAGEYVKAVTTLGPEKERGDGSWYALAG